MRYVYYSSVDRSRSRGIAQGPIRERYLKSLDKNQQLSLVEDANIKPNMIRSSQYISNSY